MGATEPGRWQFWQERCRMGATSLANVTCPGLAAGCCAPSDALAARAIAAVTNIWGLVFIVVSLPDLTPDRMTLAWFAVAASEEIGVGVPAIPRIFTFFSSERNRSLSRRSDS
jgi:hypothetical protein